MNPVVRKIISTLAIGVVLLAMLVAWFYISALYGEQSFGFHNFDANPGLEALFGILNLLVGGAAIWSLARWGWTQRNNKLTK